MKKRTVKKMSSNTIYLQSDPRWGSLPYPKRPSTVGSSGCGLLAVTHCMMEEPEYDNATPKTFYSYMKQYAVVGHGTEWKGIYNGLKHFGYEVSWPNIGKSMKPAWEILPHSMKRGVLLLRAGTRGGVTWTGSGHYVCFTRFKLDVKTGKHKFKIKDSSGRRNNGWFSYESNMRGILPQIWICTAFHGNYPKLKKTAGYGGIIPSPTLRRGTTEKTKTKQWQEFLNWTFGEKVIKTPRGNFKSKTELYTKYFQKNCGLVADGIVGPKTVAKARAMCK